MGESRAEGEKIPIACNISSAFLMIWLRANLPIPMSRDSRFWFCLIFNDNRNLEYSMKTIMQSTVTRFFAVALMLGFCRSEVRAADGAPVKSKLGYEATSVKPAEPEEGASDTIIRKDGKEVLRVPHAKPISFSPDGRILLLAQAAADDDCQQFLLDVTVGKLPGKILKVGGRYVVKSEWSKDGKTLTFTSSTGGTTPRVETITVADHCSVSPAKDK